MLRSFLSRLDPRFKPRPSHLLIGGLALVGGLKAVDVIGELVPGADHVPAGAAQAQTVPPKPGAPSGVPVPASLPDSCPVPEELLSAIRTERELLADQKDALSQRRAEIDLAEEKLRIETARLTELKTALEALMNKVETAEGEDVNRLVKLYTNMKPADAAQIMNEIDISVAVTVLGQMPERDAGPIMARLSMARARAVSKIILERSKLPGDQDLNGIVLQ
ncbi:hypothetical protein BV394_05255 [Brevirhabdus pacifica]|uniref:Uncharacterized protein n=3 Tax=Brevirhabdus pacifica TaxID=1267768 RepID=A0A1U7DGR8_9RHOB|nr:hypothetical protein BV394_05255 [Brevirhabdus pacifica]PJJ86204.1 flagellar motility protein MotE (MotC chaperone) [Brevirhabdus pacifica]